jgi:hypothetical protein
MGLRLRSLSFAVILDALSAYRLYVFALNIIYYSASHDRNIYCKVESVPSSFSIRRHAILCMCVYARVCVCVWVCSSVSRDHIFLHVTAGQIYTIILKIFVNNLISQFRKSRKLQNLLAYSVCCYECILYCRPKALPFFTLVSVLYYW